MLKKVAVCVASALLFSMLLCQWGFAAENLLKNPSFEEVDNNMPLAGVHGFGIIRTVLSSLKWSRKVLKAGSTMLLLRIERQEMQDIFRK